MIIMNTKIGNVGDMRYSLAYTEGDDEHFRTLPLDAKQIVLAWIYWNIYPAEKPLRDHTSYGMKHTLHRRTGVYLTNNQMKEAMMIAGFQPCNEYETNWHFKIKKSSPIFRTQIDGECGLPFNLLDPPTLNKIISERRFYHGEE